MPEFTKNYHKFELNAVNINSKQPIIDGISKLSSREQFGLFCCLTNLELVQNPPYEQAQMPTPRELLVRWLAWALLSLFLCYLLSSVLRPWLLNTLYYYKVLILGRIINWQRFFGLWLGWCQLEDGVTHFQVKMSCFLCGWERALVLKFLEVTCDVSKEIAPLIDFNDEVPGGMG